VILRTKAKECVDLAIGVAGGGNPFRFIDADDPSHTMKVPPSETPRTDTVLLRTEQGWAFRRHSSGVAEIRKTQLLRRLRVFII
jgi:hypothetical protein